MRDSRCVDRIVVEGAGLGWHPRECYCFRRALAGGSLQDVEVAGGMGQEEGGPSCPAGPQHLATVDSALRRSGTLTTAFHCELFQRAVLLRIGCKGTRVCLPFAAQA